MKYKNGQKVKIIKNEARSVNRIGDIGVITQTVTGSAISNSYYRVQVTGRSRIFNMSYESDIELVVDILNANTKTI